MGRRFVSASGDLSIRNHLGPLDRGEPILVREACDGVFIWVASYVIHLVYLIAVVCACVRVWLCAGVFVCGCACLLSTMSIHACEFSCIHMERDRSVALYLPM